MHHHLLQIESKIKHKPEQPADDLQATRDQIIAKLRGKPPWLAIDDHPSLSMDLSRLPSPLEFDQPNPARKTSVIPRIATNDHLRLTEEAERWGLVNRVFPEESFERDVDGFVTELASRPKEAISLTKGLLYELADLSIGDGIARGAEVNVEARQSEACKAGVKAFLRRHKGSP